MTSDYLHDIREGTLVDLKERVRDQKFARYLSKVRMTRVRSLIDQSVSFDFPVTAVIGPNGGGKSTVLGAAALAYQDIKPRTFFAKSHIGDDSMQDWSIHYEIIDRSIQSDGPIQRISKFHNKKWVRDKAPRRAVAYFGISRTVPATEKTIFQRIQKSSFKVHGEISPISEAVAEKVARILGKPVDKYRRGLITEKEKFYLGESDLGKYSELHFGAGEASILRMVSDLEEIESNSMVLIEEIENGLHPIAVAKMLEYLIDLSERKKIQAIFTTHSDVAIDPLPREAVWASVDGRLQQGKLSVEATRAISGRIDRKLSIFTEDSFAELWLRMILNSYLPGKTREVGVYGLTGDTIALQTHLGHEANPAIETPSLCVLDGDSSIQSNIENGVYKLPGEQPENYIFTFAEERLEQASALLCAYCQINPSRQNEFANAVRKIRLNTDDPHLYFSKLGMELDFTSEVVVKRAFLKYWCDNNEDECRSLILLVEEKLQGAA